MRPVLVLADTLDVARSCLLDAPALAAYGRRVFVTDPKDVSLPWVRLTRIGGALDVPVPTLERAMFDVQSFAPPGDGAARAAHTLARTVRAVLLASVGYSTAGGTITRVDENVGLAWEPDDSRTPPWPRWTLTATLTIQTKEV